MTVLDDYPIEGEYKFEGTGVPEELFQGLATFRKSLRQFLAFSEDAASSVGVTTHQYQAMLAIRAHPERLMTVGELARELLLKPHGAVQLIDRLELLGKVVRLVSDTDRRLVLLKLTADGDRLIEQLAAAHFKELVAHQTLLSASLRSLRALARQI